MDFSLFLKEAITGSFNSILSMAKIVIPLMIVMEILKDLNILEKLSKKLSVIAKFLNISNEAVFPLVIGLIFGLAYGAGFIIESAEEYKLGKKDLYILMIFLVACHAVIEDTLLFVVVGVNLWFLLTVRIIVAIIITRMASRVLNKMNLQGNIDKT